MQQRVKKVKSYHALSYDNFLQLIYYWPNNRDLFYFCLVITILHKKHQLCDYYDL